MSVTAMGRTFWTEFPHLSYTDKKGKKITIKDTTAKIVLLAIADNADDFGENSYQSFETLATKASVDRRSVMRVVRALVSNGFLVVAGVSVYGTNNYTVCLDKLGHPPTKRAKNGRPKSGDSEALLLNDSDSVTEIGDSEDKTGDSRAETGDPRSPESSSNHPLPVPESEEERNPLFVLYENTLGALTTPIADWLEQAEKEYSFDWVVDAIQVSSKSGARFPHLYCKSVLDRWKREGRAEKKPSKKDPNQRAAVTGDYLNSPYAEYIEH